MHLKITRIRQRGRVLEYASIVHSYREGRRINHKVLKNLGRIRSSEDLRRFEGILESMRRGEKVLTATVTDIRVLNTLDFGLIHATQELWDAYGISGVMADVFSDGRFKFDAPTIVRFLATHRLHEPSSDLATHEWMRRDAFVDARDIKQKHVYRALEQLIKRKKQIEAGIFKEFQQRLGLKADLIFYDLTSSYFEGDGPELAEYGKSRDRRTDRKQLVLALAVIDGIPVFHEVFEGNTADKTTLKHTVKKLKEHLDIGRIIFVADRGLFSGENLDFLDEEDYACILALKRRRDKGVEELIRTPIETRERVFVKEVKRDGNRRYILCFNRDTAREQREHLGGVRRSLERELKELAESYRREGRGRKPSLESLIRRAFEILGKHRRLFNVKFDRGLRFGLNREAWAYENAIAGRFLLVTTSDLTAEQVMESYKELCSVERAFREIKNFVDIRPIYHFDDDMVKAHVFVCVLAYLTEALIQRLVPYQSARRTIQELKRIKVTEMAIGDERISLVREMKSSDLGIFGSLGIEAPQTYIEM